jgi:carbon-monoxide dehydrogenase medium subunit
MYPAEFEYLAAESVDEAVALLEAHDDAEVLAGGQSLVPLQKTRLATPAYLVDLNGIDDLAYVRQRDGELRIGAMTRHTTVEESPLVREHVGLFSECVGQIADRQVRNQGTVGGTIAEADPSGDYFPVLELLNPTVVVAGPDGTRTTPFAEFYQGLFTVDLAEAELVTEVRLPAVEPTDGAAAVGGTYRKHAERSGDYAIVGEAAIVHVDDAGTVVEADLAVGAVGPLTRLEEAAAAVEGTSLSEDALEAAAAAAREGVDPEPGEAAAYQRRMAGVFAERTLQTAYDRAEAQL